MNVINQIIPALKAYYDKVIAAVVVIGLLVSFVLLAVQLGTIPKKRAEFDGVMRGMGLILSRTA